VNKASLSFGRVVGDNCGAPKRDKAAALKLLKRTMKKCGRPRTVVTDRLRGHSFTPGEAFAGKLRARRS
jgi:hypothetical protein